MTGVVRNVDLVAYNCGLGQQVAYDVGLGRDSSGELFTGTTELHSECADPLSGNLNASIVNPRIESTP